MNCRECTDKFHAYKIVYNCKIWILKDVCMLIWHKIWFCMNLQVQIRISMQVGDNFCVSVFNLCSMVHGIVFQLNGMHEQVVDRSMSKRLSGMCKWHYVMLTEYYI